MNFAHWKVITAPTGITNVFNGEHRRDINQYYVAECFIIDIPEGTTKDDVVNKLLAKLFRYGGRKIEETDGLAFDNEWPPEIQRQFESTKKCPWLEL
jgi:hypothetical protein